MKPLILVIDDEPNYRQLYTEILTQAGFELKTVSSATQAVETMKNLSPAMIVSDVKMPGMDGITFLKMVREISPHLPFLLITAYPDIRDAVNALKLGAVDYLEKPIDLEELVTAVSDALGIRMDAGDEQIPEEFMNGIVAESKLIRTMLRDAYRVAQTDTNILITGESGTGKEILARFIHRCGKRASGPFVPLNCAAIPPHILASELFGHRKGAFTGAVSNRKGRFRESETGTLFLDEIGDMPLELQPSLLRAIETGKISPVGSDKEVDVDFRLIAASNKDLLEEVAKNRFREDLYYRLNVIAFELPPLRDRPEDILPLARHFLSGKKSKVKRFSPATAQIIMSYQWPGNARELANAIERASILSNTEVILPEHLPPAIVKSCQIESSEPVTSSDNQTVKSISEVEKDAIKSALEKTNGNRTKAAELLGIGRRTLIYKLKRMDMQQ